MVITSYHRRGCLLESDFIFSYCTFSRAFKSFAYINNSILLYIVYSHETIPENEKRIETLKVL